MATAYEMRGSLDQRVFADGHRELLLQYRQRVQGVYVFHVLDFTGSSAVLPLHAEERCYSLDSLKLLKECTGIPVQKQVFFDFTDAAFPLKLSGKASGFFASAEQTKRKLLSKQERPRVWKPLPAVLD